MKKLLLLPSILSFLLVSSQLYAQSIDTLWSEDFEGDWTENWFVDAGTWEVGDASSGPDTAYRGINCAATVLAGNYSEGVRSRLIRFKKFTVPAENLNPRLRFRHWFSFSSADYGYIQIKTEHGNWQNISPKYYGTGSGIWTYPLIDLKPFADSLVQIAFYFQSDNQYGGTIDVSSGWYIDNIAFIEGNYVFSANEGFESGAVDWAAERGAWEVGTPSTGPGKAYSGDNCLATKLNGNYDEGLRTKFFSPPFKVKPATDDPGLRFWHWYSFSSADYGEIYVRYHNQDTWQLLSNRFSSTSSGVWTTYYASLSAYADSIIQLAFYFHSDNHNGGPIDVSSGWYIDDVKIDGVPLHDRIIVENDLGITWVGPAGKPLCGTSGEQPVTVRVKNFGEYAVSNFDVGYSTNNGLSYLNETVFQSVDPGDSLEYTFRRRADMADEELYQCKAIVRVPYDVNDTNDVAAATVENNRLIADISTTDTKCNEATGSAEILNISGRQGPFELNWTTGDTDMKAENLEAGVYFITITDANGCKSVKSFTINDLGAPELSMDTKVNNISCFGMTDGSIDIAPIGGTKPYSYRWSTGSKVEDVTNLVKGQYDVTITDANGCAKNHSFRIRDPAPLVITAITTDASCGELNGIAELIPGGGTPPYSLNWNAGSAGSIVTGLAGGLYTARVTDSKGCTNFTTVSISEIDAPQILITSVTPASCGLNDGGINISMADPSLQYDYTWSDASTGQDLQHVAAGIYSVTVSGKDGSCSSSQVIEIPSKNPPPGEICMITVDSVTNGNLIILKDNGNADGMASANIHLLGKSGTYQVLESIDPGLTNTAADPGSNTEITSYRYRVSYVDACGNESEPGTFHETMHVVAAPDLNLNRANIFWNAYKGAEYDFFKIYKYSNLTGFRIIDTVPKADNKDFYTYTDPDLSLDDSVRYVIEIELTDPCESFKKTRSHNTIRSNKSKIVATKKSASAGIHAYSDYLNIYPNPNTGTFFVDPGTTSISEMILNIFDAQGRLILTRKQAESKGGHPEKIELNGMDPGIYMLQLILPDKTWSRTIVVE